MPKGGIPDRWLDYCAVGKRLTGTRFIAFKVPLKPALGRHLSSFQVFGISELQESLRKQNQTLGLIIDLTFTNRYYSLQDVPECLLVAKLKTEGHSVPSDDVILSFKRIVHHFLQDNHDNDLLIGVHCTHGLNRTGYLICRYLIDVDHMHPEEAIQLFQSSRGHHMERMNYLMDLRAGHHRSNREIVKRGLQPSRGEQMEQRLHHRLPTLPAPGHAHNLQRYHWRAVPRDPHPQPQYPPRHRGQRPRRPSSHVSRADCGYWSTVRGGRRSRDL